LRVLHIFDHSLPLQSGYVYRSLGLLTALRGLGWETVQLTTPRQQRRDGPLVETVDGWTFHRTAVPAAWLASLPILRELAEMWATAQRLTAVARETQPDILHAHSPVLNAVPALIAGRRLGIPVVYELRALWEDAATDLGTSAPGGLRYSATRWLETFVMRRVDAVATLCQGMRGEIVYRGIAGDKVTVIPNAVDADRFTFGEPPDRALGRELGIDRAVVVGFIGSFYNYEGLDLLIEALPAAVERVPNLRVLLVGGGPQEDRLRQMAAERNLGDRVLFTGRVKNDQVGRYYSLLDIFVCPRHSMRLTELVTPLKPLEAMALGKVVLASDVGGHKELIRDGDTGFLFRAGDRDALVARIVELAGAPQLRQRAALAGRRFVEQERRWSLSAAKYLPVYDRLLRAAEGHRRVA
jgi:glycogen synthase